MIEILQPGFRTGAVHIPASKSQAHRLLICAALSQNETVIRCRGISRDIAATADCPIPARRTFGCGCSMRTARRPKCAATASAV